MQNPKNIEEPNVKVKKPCTLPIRLRYINLILVLLIILCVFLGVYYFHFKKGPVKDILASNKALNNANKKKEPIFSEVKEKDAFQKWGDWIEEKGLTEIGDIYDSCGEHFHISY